MLVALALPGARHAWAQARPAPSPALSATYQRLLAEIQKILIFDHHAHPGYFDDPDVDAMVIPPSHLALRLRDTNPELIAAARSLFGYPYPDLAPDHEAWLARRKAELQKQQGRAYFSGILDRLNVETSLANRAAMADYLDPARFRWVFFVDSFLFPFDNSGLAARNPDEAAYMPLQDKMLRRWMKQAGLSALPPDLDGYLAFISRVLVENQRQGGIAMKFEAAYFRSLRFGDPPRAVAEAAYAKYRGGGVPESEEYTNFQDFIFRYLIREGGRLHLPVHFHSSVGAGDYFSLNHGNVLNLENVLRDPRYLQTTFVLLHGGYPYSRQAIWLAAMKNVYLDTSGTVLTLYPEEFKRLMRLWLETFPEKITYGSDAFPYNAALGAEESYWLAVHSTREALAEALAEMIDEGEISEAEALHFAHMYLHDTAASLYPRLHAH
ncbi:MAG TPA: amidohydrolase [Terriglobia bacterium]|nr:amidohydrolase [Terriglobia bacterium]